MQGMQKSLAGRAAILDRLGFSYKEIIKKPFESAPFIPAIKPQKKNSPAKELSVFEVSKLIWDASFPKIITDKNISRKTYYHNGDEASIYFYRDHNQREIDFVIEADGKLYPADVKKTAMPAQTDIRNFAALKTLKKLLGAGAVICLYPNSISINQSTVSIPVWGI
jgi:predicted AAA+ superfamily ATPase